MASPPDTVGAELEAGARVLGRPAALQTWAAVTRTAPGAAWLASGDPPPAADIVRRFRDAVAQQARGTPLATAVGLAAFRTLELRVDPRVLIPRPETEGLVDTVLAWARRRGGSGIALDLGTGSGAIALSLAAEGAFERIIASDVSPDALAVARGNRAAVAGGPPVEFRCGAWFDPLAGLVADVVVSNPPYLTSDECDALDPSVRDYEPRLALDAGPDGLEHIRAILNGAGRHLAAGGLLALEIDSRRAGVTLACARASGWRNARVATDAFGRDRYLLATKDET